MSHSRNFAIAVDGPSGRQSAWWCVVVHNDDICAIQSEFRDVCKISLRAGGRCQFSHLNAPEVTGGHGRLNQPHLNHSTRVIAS